MDGQPRQGGKLGLSQNCLDSVWNRQNWEAGERRDAPENQKSRIFQIMVQEGGLSFTGVSPLSDCRHRGSTGGAKGTH